MKLATPLNCRRLLIMTAVVFGLTLAAHGQTTLPAGSAPAALEFAHFPDRVHAFIWRNWNLVPTDRLARVLETGAAEVRGVAASMGLPAEEPIPPAHAARLHITIIRRNWHLLPYDQLLLLLDWTPDRLAEALREDDFLWIKLGSLKPACPRLLYAAPDDAAKRRAAEIRAIVAARFGDELATPAEPPLAFLRQFALPVPDPRPAPPSPDVRFLYSYFAVFGDPLLDPALDPYPDALLQRYADLGVNGVWLHVVLRHLAPSAEFPEFGADSERRLQNLRTLVARARRFGIGVYLYMNEPRAMPPAFFATRPELAGVREDEFVAMCTSQPRVRQWLSSSLEHVFRAVPDLAGVFTITASENLTSCASHGRQSQCRRCGDRNPAEIVAEVNAAIEAGVHRGSPGARVIAWDWGWADAWATDAIARLPATVQFMSVSEWALAIARGGVETSVAEYSLSSVGPGPRAARHWAAAQAAGLPCVAKVQLNNTWELSAVPYLPVMDLVAEHCGRLASADVRGMMLSWSLGGYPSPNLEIARRLAQRPAPAQERVLDDLAAERFGPAGAPHARRAWTAFSNAFREYPYHGSVVYRCPVQFGPANLLWADPTRYPSTMVGFPYDDLKGWRGPYPADVFASQFEAVAAGWKRGLDELAIAARHAPPERSAEAMAELRFARAAHLHFLSVANQSRFVMARDALANDPARRQQAGRELRRILQAEAQAARELFTLARADSRIGFEASNHYYYLPQDLVEKVINCAHLMSPAGGLLK